MTSRPHEPDAAGPSVQAPAALNTQTAAGSRTRAPTGQWIMVSILLLAAGLRFWNLGATEFKFDEARLANLAAQWADTGALPLRGMGSSAGIDNPPLAVYLIALPVWLSRDPLLITGFVAALNVLGVAGCYGLGRRYWGTDAGLIAAALLAASPWAVFYSRKVWAQDMLLPFVILFFASLLEWLVKGRRWALSGAIVLLAASIQIHMAALALLPLLVLALAYALLDRSTRRRSELWQPLLVGGAAAVVLYVPYVIADAMAGWRNVHRLAALAQTPSQLYPEALRYALLNIGGREIHALAGPERFQEFLNQAVPLGYGPDRLEEALVVVGAVGLAVRLWRRRRDRQVVLRDGLLLLWLITPPLFYLSSRFAIYPHYLIPLYPAPYLVLGAAASGLIQAVRPPGRRLLRVAGGALLAAVLAWQSYLALSIHAFVATHDTPGGMGTPVALLRQAARTARHYAIAWGNERVVVMCPGQDPSIDECPAIWDFMVGRALDLRLVDYNRSLLFPQSEGDTLIVLTPGESAAAAALPAHAQEMPGETVWLREGKGAFRFYRLPAGYAPQPAIIPQQAPVRLENGVSLLGYALSAPPSPGQTSRLSLYWRVDARPVDPPAQGYSFANHLLAADGQRWGQGDGPGYDVGSWRAGDRLLSWFDIPLPGDAPPAPYLLRVGMYVYTPPDQFRTVRVVDKANQPVADAVEWPIE